jgi:hypothetical protein
MMATGEPTEKREEEAPVQRSVSIPAFYRKKTESVAGKYGGTAVAAKNGGRWWREGVAGRVAARAGRNCVNAKKREKLLLGFNKPDSVQSGSPSPIFQNRVHLARFSKIGFT